MEDSAGEDGEGPPEAGLPGQAVSHRADLQQTDRELTILTDHKSLLSIDFVLLVFALG